MRLLKSRVVIRPARLTRPASIRSAELLVTTTRRVW